MLSKWREMTLWKRVFIGLFLGVIIGLGLHYGLGAEKGGAIATTWFKPFGDAFVYLIKMLIVPLIFFTLVSGIIAMGDPKRLGSLGVRTIATYFFTTAISSTTDGESHSAESVRHKIKLLIDNESAKSGLSDDKIVDMLRGEGVEFEGEQLTGKLSLSISEAGEVPLLVAALGPTMLKLAGTYAAGTSTWMTGPNTIRDYIVPHISAAAEEAGKPAPRIVCGLPICLTDDEAASRAKIAEDLSVYGMLPSYRAMLDKEGVEGPAELSLVGNEAALREAIQGLRDAGVDSLGMHLEAVTPEVRQRIMPGKASVSIDQYLQAFSDSVAVFGRGQVSTYILAGLGDPPEAILAMCAQLVKLGVYPFVVPFVPIAGTPLERHASPDPAFMRALLQPLGSMLVEGGLRSVDIKAGCGRCGACSSLSAYER